LGIFESAIESSFGIAPNPVRDEAAITWEFSEPSLVKIELLDCSGKMVQGIAHKQFEAGSHTATLDASVLDPGIYFCRMSTPGFSTIHKIVVLK
jgi:hypothetical protein